MIAMMDIPATAPSAGAWHVEATTSALDGAQTVIATLAADAETASSIGRPERATLVLRCSDAITAVFVTWPAVVDVDRADASWKVDDQAVVSELWDVSTTGTATGFFRGAVFVKNGRMRLLGALSGSHRFVVRVGSSGVAREASFSTIGAADAVAAVRAACPLSK